MPPRILILRTSALGDVVHALPVLRALRHQLPEAVLGWVVEEALAPLLTGHPDLDQVIPVRLRPWRQRPWSSTTRREVRRFVGRLRAFHADVALDLMGNHKAGVLARLSGARRRIGLARPFRREPASSIWINQAVTPRGDHAVERALAVLDPLSLALEPVDFGGERLLPAARPPDPPAEPLVLIHPGAGWGNKAYPPRSWGRVAELLAADPGVTVRVAMAPGEEGLAHQVAEASAGAATLVPAPDLPSLAALLRSARLVLGGDTGPIHLARALDTPVLALLGPTDPARHGPYGRPHQCLAVHLPCSFCYKRFGEAKACLWALPPERVALRARDLIRGRTAPGEATEPR